MRPLLTCASDGVWSELVACIRRVQGESFTDDSPVDQLEFTECKVSAPSRLLDILLVVPSYLAACCCQVGGHESKGFALEYKIPSFIYASILSAKLLKGPPIFGCTSGYSLTGLLPRVVRYLVGDRLCCAVTHYVRVVCDVAWARDLSVDLPIVVLACVRCGPSAVQLGLCGCRAVLSAP